VRGLAILLKNATTSELPANTLDNRRNCRHDQMLDVVMPLDPNAPLIRHRCDRRYDSLGGPIASRYLALLRRVE